MSFLKWSTPQIYKVVLTILKIIRNSFGELIFIPIFAFLQDALVAQLDRVLDYESSG